MDRTTLSAYIPIFLLSNMRNVFEKIVATRITRHLLQYGADNSDRHTASGKDDCPCALSAINMIKREFQIGDVILAVSIDIVHPFSSLPEKIKKALAHHRFPWYLRIDVGNYLSEKCNDFPVDGGNIVQQV